MLPLWTDTDNGVRVARLTEPMEVETLVQLFEGVAAQENWQPDGALRRWQHRSVYFGLESDGRFVGGLQLVLPDTAGTLPCQTVWPDVTLTGLPRRSAHIAMLALAAGQRGDPLLFWRIVVEAWRYCVAEGITTLMIEVTPRVLTLYRRLGWPLVIVGDRRIHWGEDCFLCSLNVAEVAASLLGRSFRARYARQVVMQAFNITIPVAVVTRPARRQQPSRVREAPALYLA